MTEEKSLKQELFEINLKIKMASRDLEKVHELKKQHAEIKKRYAQLLIKQREDQKNEERRMKQ